MKEKYYHVTDPKNVDSIVLDGLKANEDGQIFLFEYKGIVEPGIGVNSKGDLVNGLVVRKVADLIASNQVGLYEYALFCVYGIGIENEPVNDDVDELCSEFQWIANQETIEPEYIEFLGIENVPKYPEIYKEFRPLTDEERRLFGENG